MPVPLLPPGDSFSGHATGTAEDCHVLRAAGMIRAVDLLCDYFSATAAVIDVLGGPRAASGLRY